MHSVIITTHRIIVVIVQFPYNIVQFTLHFGIVYNFRAMCAVCSKLYKKVCK
eukprot:TRINITY_DN13667_c0_g1_i1.p2 TRINITY_DN13667_c0_g1~~TRINITY_DN13667_c0_g1_i1.p2  ORF type:complete len:52 (-),score=3.83 TRINITY_DN13667_c0_g1_i1:265-420(-)